MTVVTRTHCAIAFALALALAAGVMRGHDVQPDWARTASAGRHQPLDDANVLLRSALGHATTTTSMAPQIDGVPTGGSVSPNVLVTSPIPCARLSRIHFRPAHLQHSPLLI